MKYEVIQNFVDSQDKNKKYKVGDSYPTPGNKKISEERLASLLSADNKIGQPVIREIVETKTDQDVE
jgi:hypothetical protein